MRRNFVVVGNPADLHRNVTKQVDAEGRVRYYIDNERYYLTIRSANREAKRASGELRRRRSNPNGAAFYWEPEETYFGRITEHHLRSQAGGPLRIAGTNLRWSVTVEEDRSSKSGDARLSISIGADGDSRDKYALVRAGVFDQTAQYAPNYIRIPPLRQKSLSAAKKRALDLFLDLKRKLESR